MLWVFPVVLPFCLFLITMTLGALKLPILSLCLAENERVRLLKAVIILCSFEGWPFVALRRFRLEPKHQGRLGCICVEGAGLIPTARSVLFKISFHNRKMNPCQKILESWKDKPGKILENHPANSLHLEREGFTTWDIRPRSSTRDTTRQEFKCTGSGFSALPPA